MSMKKDQQDLDDIRVKRKILSWKSALITFAILLVLAAGQAMITNAFPLEYEYAPIGYIFGMIGYWAIVAAVFSIHTETQIRNNYDTPTRKLSSAAQKVAGGDFSVYIEPMHASNEYTHMDVLYQDFNKMVERLGSIEILQSNFIANASHELRTPLAIIQNYAEIMDKQDLSEAVRKEYTATILAATRKLAALLTNILKLNQLESGQMTPEIRTYDLCRQLGDCILRFEEQWDEKDIELEVDIEDRRFISADENLMEIVWTNLISNALKFTDRGGTVKITEHAEDGGVAVCISDTGSGMSKETQERMFERFYQGDTSHYKEGNGLGLSLARQVIIRQGGTLMVDSELGRGSAFTVTLKQNEEAA